MTRDQLGEMGKVARKNLPAVEKQYAQALRSAGQKPAGIVARVNGEEVLLSDIERHRAKLNKQAKSPVLPFTVTDNRKKQSMEECYFQDGFTCTFQKPSETVVRN